MFQTGFVVLLAMFFFKNNIKVMMDFFWTPCALCEDRDCDFLIAPLDPDEGP